MSAAKLSPIILAIDTDDLVTAGDWIEATSRSIDIYKIGLEFFLKFGSEGLTTLRERGDFEIFLDLKLHDIPNTVAGATTSVAHLNPKFLTVHASGGSQMISAAVKAAPHTDITAVTVLTSISESDLDQMGFAGSPASLALSLATNAVDAGARAIVCSPLEVAAIKSVVGDRAALVTPGVRPVGSDQGDQSRVLTPKDAIAQGSDFLVIGRPITSLAATSLNAMGDKAAEILDSIA